MITWGTNPDVGVPVTAEREAVVKALAYMGIEGGQPLLGHPIDVVFIGSCTNSRISDLRAAAAMLKGRQVSPKVRTLVVPGSQQVKREAEAEGLPEIFRAAGCQWREPGEYCVSTSNRNFEGRQGKGGLTYPGQPAHGRRQRHRRRAL